MEIEILMYRYVSFFSFFQLCFSKICHNFGVHQKFIVKVEILKHSYYIFQTIARYRDKSKDKYILFFHSNLMIDYISNVL